MRYTIAKERTVTEGDRVITQRRYYAIDTNHIVFDSCAVMREFKSLGKVFQKHMKIALTYNYGWEVKIYEIVGGDWAGPKLKEVVR